MVLKCLNSTRAPQRVPHPDRALTIMMVYPLAASQRDVSAHLCPLR